MTSRKEGEMQELLPSHYAPDKVGHLWRPRTSGGRPRRSSGHVGTTFARRRMMNSASPRCRGCAEHLLPARLQVVCGRAVRAAGPSTITAGSANSSIEISVRSRKSFRHWTRTRQAQIFHALFLVNAAGEHPGPMTIITAADIAGVSGASMRPGAQYGHRSSHAQFYPSTIRARWQKRAARTT